MEKKIMLSWSMLVIAILFNIFANFCIKLASNKGTVGLETYFSWQFILGLAFFGFNLLFYTKSLANIPLAIAYTTLVGLSVLGISIITFLFFDSQFTTKQVVGMVLLILSIYLISWKK